MKQVILASASPRRKELMHDLSIPFEVIPSTCDEILNHDLALGEAIIDIAKQKAVDVFKMHDDAIVIGCDTVVVVDDLVLGKPKNQEDARKTLKLLSGRKHQVISGVYIISKDKQCGFYEISDIYFYPLDDDTIDEYLQIDEYKDKAGSYGIQGKGKLFVSKVQGDYFNIVGLPIARLNRELKLFFMIMSIMSILC